MIVTTYFCYHDIIIMIVFSNVFIDSIIRNMYDHNNDNITATDNSVVLGFVSLISSIAVDIVLVVIIFTSDKLITIFVTIWDEIGGEHRREEERTT